MSEPQWLEEARRHIGQKEAPGAASNPWIKQMWSKLKGGMWANLALTLRLRDSAIVVPEPALVNNGDAVTVFIVDEKGAAQVRAVKIGLRLAGKAEILSGIQAGDKVVVEGVQKLFPGASVKPAPAEAAAPYLN